MPVKGWDAKIKQGAALRKKTGKVSNSSDCKQQAAAVDTDKW